MGQILILAGVNVTVFVLFLELPRADTLKRSWRYLEELEGKDAYVCVGTVSANGRNVSPGVVLIESTPESTM